MTTTSAERMRAYRARQQALGRHYVNGRLVDTPRKQRRPHEEPPHGTTHRYWWRDDPCRCTECRAANAAWYRPTARQARKQ